MMHIHSMKGATKHRKIQRLKPSPFIYIPLLKEFGNSPEPVVKVGDKVKKYQVLGKANEGFSAPIHSPVSGTVTDIKELLQINGKEALTIIIHNDFLETEEALTMIENHLCASDELVKIIEDAGIVGMGGAQFPTAKKYTLDGKKIKTFIVNGAECEPYLTCDYAVMAQRTWELFEGMLIINRILKAEEIVIAIEKDNIDLTQKFNSLLSEEKYNKFRIKVVDNEYPQGGELQLTKSVTGIEKEKKKLLADVGVIMNNVGTIYAVYDAVVNGKPLIERVITVSGENAEEVGNYEVKIGTPVKHILESTGYQNSESVIIVGGPMMGKYASDLSVAVNKGSGGVLVLPERSYKRLNCISCGYCVDVCPMFLMPFKFEEMYRKKKYLQLIDYNLNDCIDCGSCECICPSEVPLMESVVKGKSRLKEMSDDKK